MSRFKPRSPEDLIILRAGICPDCGAAVSSGMAACRACGLSFEGYGAELPAARVRAAAAPSLPEPGGSSPAPGAPTAFTPPLGPEPAARPWSLDDIDLIERGPLAANAHPLTDAEGPEVVRVGPDPRLGSALQRAAAVAMAEAAVCDDPLVLLGYPAAAAAPLVRAALNRRFSSAAVDDDPEELIATRGQPRAFASAPALAAAVERPPGGSRAVASKTARATPLSIDDIELLERPVLLRQPHSHAEAADVADGAHESGLGAVLIRGATVTMPDAAVVDDPLVLLGYKPPPADRVARASINLKSSDGAGVDDVSTLLARPRPLRVTTQPATESTVLLDRSDIRTAVAPTAPDGRRPTTGVTSRGAARSID